MKSFPAIIFTLLITAVIGGGIFLIGGNALLNPDQAPVNNSPAAAPTANTDPNTNIQSSFGQQLV